MSQRRRLRRQQQRGSVAALVELPGGEETTHGCEQCRGVERRKELTEAFVSSGHALELMGSRQAARVSCIDCGAEWEVRFSAGDGGGVVSFSPRIKAAVLQ